MNIENIKSLFDKIENIKSLFGKNNIYFKVPLYQRAYSWQEEQLAQFVEDLSESKRCGYHLGHFLFEPMLRENGEMDDMGKVVYVIDGQQRLTTCVIFFSALVSVLKNRKAEWKHDEEIINKYIIEIENRYLRNEVNREPKFQTVEYDNNLFSDIIVNCGVDVWKDSFTSKSQGLIYGALCYFKKVLDKFSVNEICLLGRSLENACITTCFADNKLQAVQIFSYQNDRGRNLTNLEVLKAYFMLLMYQAGSSDNDVRYVERSFEDIYHNIAEMTVEEDSVLNYYWKSVGEKGYGSEKTVPEVKVWVRNIPIDKRTEKIREFAKKLSRAFDVVKKVERDDSFDVKNLKNLNNMSYAYPMIIRARLVNVKDDTFLRLIKLLENITFRTLLRGGRADIESRLQTVFNEAIDDDGFNKMIDNIKNKVKGDWWWRFWNDDEVFGRLRGGWFYGNKVDNYLLWRYEQHLCVDNYPVPRLCFGDVINNESIEHIAPQTENNLVESGYGIYEDENNKINGIVSGEWMNCVGNLVLMAKAQNSSLGNKPFSHKVQVFGSDNLLNQQKEIIKFVKDKNNPVWDRECIEKRRDIIVQAAEEIWNLNNI